MSVLDRIRAAVKEFHRSHPGETPIIRIDPETALEFMDLKPADIGDEYVQAIYRHGVKALSTAFGYRILWDSPEFGAVPMDSTLKRKWEKQEEDLRAAGTPRHGTPKP